MAIEKILVPDLGDASDVEVIELLVAVGDTVAEEDSLLVLESDKAAMEIPAPKSGVVKSLEINLGDKVSSGSVILTLEVEAVDDETDVAEAAPLEQSEAEPIVEKTPAPVSPAAAVPSIYDIKVPDIGTDDEVEVIEIQVAVGDSLSLDDTLITLESDKAAMDVPADRAGEVQEILVKVGDKVKKGASIVRILAEPVEDAPRRLRLMLRSPSNQKPQNHKHRILVQQTCAPLRALRQCPLLRGPFRVATLRRSMRDLQ